MDAPAKRRATYDDIAALPEGKTGELIEGDLYISGRPSIRHTMALMSLLRQLDAPGWIILREVEIKFGKKSLLVPDLAGWRRERLPSLPDVQSLDIIPDWVCEGLKLETAGLDKGRKRELYAKHKVTHLWFLDPDLKMLEVMTLDGDFYRATKAAFGDDRGSFAPFKRKLDLSKFWKL